MYKLKIFLALLFVATPFAFIMSLILMAFDAPAPEEVLEAVSACNNKTSASCSFLKEAAEDGNISGYELKVFRDKDIDVQVTELSKKP